MDPRHSDDELDYTALARLFAGELPAEEAEALRRWIDEDGDRRELVEGLHDVWEHAESLGQSWDTEQALGAIRMKARRRPAPAPDVLPLRRPAPRRVSERVSPARRPRWWMQPAAAAAVLLVVGASALWWLTTRSTSGNGEALAEVVTGTAERGELRLPDGTRVVVGADSRLRYPKEFGRRSRDVFLAGAAYFEVAPSTRRPFRVHSEHGVAEVLGTRFGVRAYPGAEATEVAMVEGQVALGPPIARVAERAPAATPRDEVGRVVLRAGDVGVIDAAGDVEVEHDADVDRRLAWTAGRLVFHDTPLGDAAAELARWYDVEVRIADSTLAAQPLTASFEREPIAQVLVVIASAVDAHYERDGRVVTLWPNGAVR